MENMSPALIKSNKGTAIPRAVCVRPRLVLLYVQNTAIHVPFVCACEFMCLACLREITQSAKAAVAVRVRAENGVFVAALAS